MHGSANSNIFETLVKSVTSHCDEKRKQTVATLVVYLKVYGLKEVYSPKLLEPASSRCRVIVLEIVSSCMNLTVFSFVMVSNNKTVCATFMCYVASSV